MDGAKRVILLDALVRRMKTNARQASMYQHAQTLLVVVLLTLPLSAHAKA